MRLATILSRCAVLFGFLVANAAAAEDLVFQGQLSGWLYFSDTPSVQALLGLRYVPAFSLKKRVHAKWTLDAEISLNAFGSAEFRSSDGIPSEGDIKPYRVWLRLASSQFEARLGLQKINFGSAALLRPLMWFDRLDPNDPLQLTDGVYGLLLRYFFPNNANIWLWGLYGNDQTKGWEAFPTARRKPEFGGRLQVPLPNGELAWTYHYRRLDARTSEFIPPVPGESEVRENRFALDGKWDFGIGLWAEGVLVHQDYRVFRPRYQRMLAVGADYTFSIGNGLHVLGEHLVLETAEKLAGPGEGSAFSSLSLSYPLSLLDQVRGVVYHNWETGDWYRFISWQRTYDRWMIFMIGFWNPETYRLYNLPPGKNLFSGKGFEIMVVFNH